MCSTGNDYVFLFGAKMTAHTNGLKFISMFSSPFFEEKCLQANHLLKLWVRSTKQTFKGSSELLNMWTNQFEETTE